MTAEQKELIRTGLARVYKGRLIPRVKGGATYTPLTAVTAKTLGNGSANITTWQYQNTGTLGAIIRTMIFTGQAGATGAYSVEIGVTGATAVQAQRIIDGKVLTANVSDINNGWFNVPINHFLSAFGNAATITGAAYGVTAS